MSGDSQGNLFVVTIIGAALALLVAWCAMGLGPTGAYLVSISVVTFLLYGYDKYQAVNGNWRVPEMVLHAVTLVGGTPGAFAGQIVFRHKTRKGSFRSVFFMIVLLQAAVLTYWVIAH